jgi:Undecaprenyl-phosphate glucose phosphotransferase
MAKAAFQRARLKTEQDEAPAPAADAVAVDARIAELRAAFEMFGARADEEEPAPAALAQVEIPPATPIKARASFPDLKRRSLRVEPATATRLIRWIDWVVVALAAELAAHWAMGMSLAGLPLGQAFAFVVSAGALKAGLWLTEVYKVSPGRIRPEHGMGGLALGAVAGLTLATALAPDARAAAALSAILPVAAILLASIHAAYALWFRAAHRVGAFSENIVLVGATDAAERLAARARETGEARIVAVVDDRLSRAPDQLGGAPVAGGIEDLLAWSSLPEVDRIVITVTQKAEARVRAMIEALRVVPNRIDLLLDYDTESVRGRRVDRVATAAFACVSGRPHGARRAIVKRVQDVVLGAALLCVFAPIMLLIAAAIRCGSRGPALYRQRRHGFNNRIITVWKFRTMRHEPGAPLRQVQSGDPRVTRLGKFLRRTSLDELPQLFNVLAGEMSLVGPRPHAVGMQAGERDLDHIVAEYAHRHRVKPGITGWAQVNGSRGPIETCEAVRERVKLDLDYVSRASLLLDLWILLRTAPALLGDRKGPR